MTEPDVQTVAATAALARLEIDSEHAERLARDFGRILGAFERLAELDLEGAEEMARPGRGAGPLREDHPRPSLPVELVLGNAPEREGDFFAVPKTVGGEG